MNLYKSLFDCEEVKFDLTANQPCFEMRKNFIVSTRDSFSRTTTTTFKHLYLFIIKTNMSQNKIIEEEEEEEENELNSKITQITKSTSIALIKFANVKQKEIFIID